MIYGRFGYGVATMRTIAEIDTDRVRLTVPPGTDDVRLRFAEPAAVRDQCEAVYARLVAGRPGMTARRPGWEDLPLLDPPSEREGSSPLRCVVAERDGEVVGYTRYFIKPEWDVQGPKGTVLLRDLEALDPASYAALWRFLFDIDLTRKVAARSRPVDDAWQHLVSDIRRCGVQQVDSLHVRLVDLGASLEARTYQAPVDVVFEVADAFCPWNEGRWRLTGDAKGASCKRTEGRPISPCPYGSWGPRISAGCPSRHSRGPVGCGSCGPGRWRRRHAAFGSAVAPWLPHGF